MPFEFWKVFLAPFDDVRIFVDDKLDAVGHGFQTRQRNQTFHGSSQQVEERLTKGYLLDGFFHFHSRNAAHIGIDQTADHEQGHHDEDAQQGKNNPRRFAASADGEIPGDCRQRPADQEMPDPVCAVQPKHREQLVAARKRGNNDGENVILNQHDCHDQTQARCEIAHGCGVRSAAFVENSERVHVQARQTRCWQC